MPEPAPYRPVSRPYKRRFGYVYRQHVFDKLRSVDLGLPSSNRSWAPARRRRWRRPDEIKELILLVSWLRPLHVVIVVDAGRQEERLVTVYEPFASEWAPDLRRRR